MPPAPLTLCPRCMRVMHDAGTPDGLCARCTGSLAEVACLDCADMPGDGFCEHHVTHAESVTPRSLEYAR